MLAQGDSNTRLILGDAEATQRVDDYLNLLNKGYAEVEIFQDLANANLLSENYDSAVFWYEKLLQHTAPSNQRRQFEERYVYASKKLAGKLKGQHKDWGNAIMKDYKSPSPSQHLKNVNEAMVFQDYPNDIAQSNTPIADEKIYEPKLAVTANGKVAFFSKAVVRKPSTGIFSKKEVVHELYRAENIRGNWKNITKVNVCPKYASAKHPTVSADGTRLFFASNMPGTYGKYDIYVAEILRDGSLGQAKNLGPKVNTRKDDMYPSLVNGSTLLFASNGRKGQGGFDLYAVTVKGNRLSQSKNLGNSVNSRYDDYALTFSRSKGMGFVVSNRGDRNQVSQYAVAPKYNGHLPKLEKDDQKLWNALNNENQTDYSLTIFED